MFLQVISVMAQHLFQIVHMQDCVGAAIIAYCAHASYQVVRTASLNTVLPT